MSTPRFFESSGFEQLESRTLLSVSTSAHVHRYSTKAAPAVVQSLTHAKPAAATTPPATDPAGGPDGGPDGQNVDGGPDGGPADATETPGTSETDTTTAASTTPATTSASAFRAHRYRHHFRHL